MPSVAQSKMWYIRVTGSHEYLRPKINLMREWVDFSGMFVGLHHVDKEDSNPHCHIALKLHTNLQKQSLDTRVKKLFDVSGAQYSSKVWDGDSRALSYMYHDEKVEIFNFLGLTDAEIAELKRTNEIVMAQVAVAKEKAGYKVIDYVLSKLSDGVTRYEIFECILGAVEDGLFHHPGGLLNRYILECELLLHKNSSKQVRDKIKASQWALLRLD